MQLVIIIFVLLHVFKTVNNLSSHVKHLFIDLRDVGDLFKLVIEHPVETTCEIINITFSKQGWVLRPMLL